LSSLATQAKIFLKRLSTNPVDCSAGASTLATAIVDAHGAAEKGLERLQANILSLEASLRSGDNTEEKRVSQVEDEVMYIKNILISSNFLFKNHLTKIYN
jgi:hypothetical protein